MVRRAAVAQPDVRLVAEAIRTPRAAATCRCPARPRAGPPGPRRPWPAASGAAAAQLLLAPDQRGERRRAGPRTGSSAAPAPSDAPGPDRFGEALERPAAQVGVLEQAADELARARRRSPPCRAGQRLQPRREVRRLADDRLLLRRPSPIRSPTTTTPVAMPPAPPTTSPGRGSPAAAATVASPARTARSASSSWARGSRNRPARRRRGYFATWPP